MQSIRQELDILRLQGTSNKTIRSVKGLLNNHHWLKAHFYDHPSDYTVKCAVLYCSFCHQVGTELDKFGKTFENGYWTTVNVKGLNCITSQRRLGVMRIVNCISQIREYSQRRIEISHAF